MHQQLVVICVAVTRCMAVSELRFGGHGDAVALVAVSELRFDGLSEVRLQ